MNHHCKVCGKTPEQTKFSLQDGSNLRSVCNLCRSMTDKERREIKLQPPPQKVSSDGKPRDSWLDLCWDCRPDWGWNHRHIPTNHNKGQEFQI